MSDVSDVMNTVASQIAGFVYPNGTGQPSVTGTTINAFPGWPLPDQIDSDMPKGIADVSVYPVPNVETNTTRYRPKAVVMSIAEATITLVAGNRMLTVGGVMPSPFTAHNVAALIAGQAFIYSVQSTDTLTSIATGLGALIARVYPGTTNTGPVISLPSGLQATVARVGTTGQVTTEWERQKQLFQITVWAPDPVTRATIGTAIKTPLSQITFLTATVRASSTGAMHCPTRRRGFEPTGATCFMRSSTPRRRPSNSRRWWRRRSRSTRKQACRSSPALIRSRHG